MRLLIEEKETAARRSFVSAASTQDDKGAEGSLGSLGPLPMLPKVGSLRHFWSLLPQAGEGGWRAGRSSLCDLRDGRMRAGGQVAPSLCDLRDGRMRAGGASRAGRGTSPRSDKTPAIPRLKWVVFALPKFRGPPPSVILSRAKDLRAAIAHAPAH